MPTLLLRLLPLIVLAVLLFSSNASACSSRVDDGLSTFPGFGFLGLYVGFVLPILAGFLERPFVSWAGVTRGALPLSLQGSILTALISFAGTLALYSTLHTYYGTFASVAFLSWSFSAVLLAALVKYYWIRLRTRSHVSLPRLFAGAVFSSVIIFFLPLYQFALGAEHWVSRTWIFTNLNWWAPATILASLSVYLLAFCHSGTARHTSPFLHAFEVLPAST